MKAAPRGRAIALSFVRLNAGPAQYDGDREATGKEEAARAVAGPAAHANDRENQPPHGNPLRGPQRQRANPNCRLLFYPRMLYFAQCRIPGP